MPSTTPRQQRFMGTDLARKRAGKKTKTGMSEKQLMDFASALEVANGRKKRRDSVDERVASWRRSKTRLV